MAILFRLVVYGLSVWISNRYADGSWVVGPAFAAVVLAYDWKGLKENAVRGVLFFAASTLIYALVYRITNLKWGNDSDLFEYFLGPFPIAIVIGSVLLPAAHAVLFRKPVRLALRAAALLAGSFYFVTVLGYANEEWGIGPEIPWLPILVAVWQGAYLWHFFIRKA